MTFSFRPAVRSNVGLLIGLAGSSGAGKTFTAMRLATGISGGKPFAVIDTEAGRATHYADRFAFHHGDLAPPFTPERYAEAIAAADKEGYPVIIVDSMSHEWAGDGGVLDMQEAEYQRMGGSDKVKIASWIRPKMAHKHMVAKLLQVRAHLILCFRAEEKIEISKDEKGKTVITPKVGPGGFKGWLPITEKNLPYELTASFLLTAEAPGVPLPIKLQEQHRALFPLDQPITEEAGKRIAEWAAGGSAPRVVTVETQPGKTYAEHSTVPATLSDTPYDPAADYISLDQMTYLTDLCSDHGINKESLCKAAGVPDVAHILAANYKRAEAWIDAAIEKRRTQ